MSLLSLMWEGGEEREGLSFILFYPLMTSCLLKTQIRNNCDEKNATACGHRATKSWLLFSLSQIIFIFQRKGKLASPWIVFLAQEQLLRESRQILPILLWLPKSKSETITDLFHKIYHEKGTVNGKKKKNPQLKCKGLLVKWERAS